MKPAISRWLRTREAFARQHRGLFHRSPDERSTFEEHLRWEQAMFARFWFYRTSCDFVQAPPPRMNDGFVIDPGWRPLLEKLSARLLKLAGDKTSPRVRLTILQVKEKFGGLRFYHRVERPPDVPEPEYRRLITRIDKWIKAAENRSYRMCERCGARIPGLKIEARHETACDRCRK